MDTTAYKAAAGRALQGLRRALPFALLWWVLSEGEGDAWRLGTIAVAAATAASLYLVPPGRWRISAGGLAGFAGFFLWNSLHGGSQVALMALRPAPDLRPALLELSLSLPAGAPRVLLVNAIGLMPGTLAVCLDGAQLSLHVLDERLPVAQKARALEAHVARLFGVADKPEAAP
jgi:multicomponent Na+:H+ antiporter subunit E